MTLVQASPIVALTLISLMIVGSAIFIVIDMMKDK